MPSKKTKTVGGTALGILFAVLVLIAQQLGWIDLKDEPKDAPRPRQTPGTPTATRERPDTNRTAQTDAHPITQLQEKNRSGVHVTGEGTIVKVLPDDNEGSRHQRFLVELSDGHTIKISHNIDLAPRVPDPREGDTITFKGDFEANELGGAVHWTHHDPQQRHPDGYLEHNGKRYE